MEKPRPSLVDTVLPLQSKAWELEHQALLAKRDGAMLIAKYLREEAWAYRSQDIHNKIQVLFDRSDAQNAIIDIGLKMMGRKVPILQPK